MTGSTLQYSFAQPLMALDDGSLLAEPWRMSVAARRVRIVGIPSRETASPASPRVAPLLPALDTTGFGASNDNLAAANDNRPDPARYPQQRALITDATKTTVWSAAYEPFGRVTSITGPATQNLGLPGQWFQLETGLAYNWHRHYDPTTGKYTTADPLGFVDGPSVYAYAGNNPHRWVDETGLAEITGFTKHGINQVINRGICPIAILDAVNNPPKVVPKPNNTIQYRGSKATIVLNQSGAVVTAWPQ